LYYETPHILGAAIRLVRLAYQPLATVLSSQNKSAPAISHQPNEQADQQTSQCSTITPLSLGINGQRMKSYVQEKMFISGTAITGTEVVKLMC
jgi:hypothetical protein